MRPLLVWPRGGSRAASLRCGASVTAYRRWSYMSKTRRRTWRGLRFGRMHRGGHPPLVWRVLMHPTCRNVPPIPLHRHARVRLLLPPYDCHSTPVARERTILFGSTYCCVPCEYRVATFMTSERVARRFTAARVSCWVQRTTHTAPHTTHAHPAKQHQQWVCVQYRHGYR